MKKEQKTLGNKGFSLVELIVVIAIMVVLVAVLAPVFTRYVEKSRRATDVQNANTIATAILTDVASGDLDSTKYSGVLKDGTTIKSIQSAPTAQGTPGKGRYFYYAYDETTNTVTVKIANAANDAAEASCPNLCDPTAAKNYSEATGKTDWGASS